MTAILLDFVAHYARTTPGKQAAVDLASGRSWTYAELDSDVRRCAAALRDLIPDPAGERVVTLCRNSVDMLILHFACIRTGAIYVPLNWRLAAPEIAFLVADCRPALIVHEIGFAALLPERPAVRRLSISAEQDQFREAIDAAAPEGAPGAGVARDPDAPITILYSSGTTGEPKGAILTLMNAFSSGLNLALGTHVTSDSVFLCDMPMFHTVGLMAACRVPLMMGGSVLISQKFDAETSYRRLADPALGISHFFSVPQMAMMMRQVPGFDGTKLARLTAYITGGAPNPEAHVKRWLDDGVAMLNAWGMSETGSCLAQPLGDFDRIRAHAASVGLPHLCVEMRLVDEQGTDIPDGTVGEVWIRGANLTPGYWERPELNAKAFEDGWFKTGDAAFRDADGFYTLVDRIKDMFISGGENVYPAEIEAAITEMPEVSEVAVIGVADARWGEVGCAFVIAAPGAVLSEQAVLRHCNARLARYKVPKRVIITQMIERTASGKVQKHLLKARWEELATRH